VFIADDAIPNLAANAIYISLLASIWNRLFIFLE
jgi:hypothetical protein